MENQATPRASTVPNFGRVHGPKQQREDRTPQRTVANFRSWPTSASRAPGQAVPGALDERTGATACCAQHTRHSTSIGERQPPTGSGLRFRQTGGRTAIVKTAPLLGFSGAGHYKRIS